MPFLPGTHKHQYLRSVQGQVVEARSSGDANLQILHLSAPACLILVVHLGLQKALFSAVAAAVICAVHPPQTDHAGSNI